jgi:cytosine/adenosine deaminase-related metal-dependent hydrolase
LILPISANPIENGEVVVEGDRISEVRPIPTTGTPQTDFRDLGEAIIMPGLVNVHTHLEYTVMRGLLEDMPFFPWIRELTARKTALIEQDWIASATMGAAEALAGGVTTIGDCTDSGAALLGAKALGLRGIIYQEAFSVEAIPTVEEVLSDLKLKVAALQWSAAGTLLKVGISPHSPYTVQPEAFRGLAGYAKDDNLPVCIHAAESQSEAELIRSARGIIAERLDARGISWHRPASGTTTVQYLQGLGAINARTLLVHGVQLSAHDCDIIRGTNAAWAFCPKSNAKLGNGIAPLGLFRECYETGRERIGLGSDSVASNNTMDMFEEMRFAVLSQRAHKRRFEAMTAREALEMATVGGARALGLDHQVGTLEPGKQADIIAVNLESLPALPCYDPYSALVYSASARDVALTMIAGETLYDNGAFRKTNIAGARSLLMAAAQKMRSWTAPE